MLTISYDRLWALLKRRGMHPADLSRACGLSGSTIRQLQKGEDGEPVELPFETME